MPYLLAAAGVEWLPHARHAPVGNMAFRLLDGLRRSESGRAIQRILSLSTR